PDALPASDVPAAAAAAAAVVPMAAGQAHGAWPVPWPLYSAAYQEVTRGGPGSVSVVRGELELAFGAVRVPIARDREHAVHAVQLHLAGWVADAAGLLLALVWTAGFLPGFLEAGSV